MSTSSIRVIVPAPVPCPRGAIFVASLVTWLLRFSRAGLIGRAIWRALEREGQLRAQRALRTAAARYETSDPMLARQLLEASQFDFDKRLESSP